MADFKDFVKQQASQFVDTSINNFLDDLSNPSGSLSGFNVQNMLSSLNKSGFAKADHFEVLITGPGGNVESARDLAVRADSVDMPGRNFGLTEHKFTNVGPFNRIPTMQTYTDVTMTFILSEDLREKEYFEIWQDKIMDTGAFEVAQRSTQLNPTTGELELDTTTSNYNLNYTNARFMHKYFEKYIGRVEIRHYGDGGNLTSIHTLSEAYPISIAPIGLNWGDEGIAKLAVSFAYKNYRVVFNKRSQPGLGNGFYFNLGKGGTKFGVRLAGVGNVSYTKETGYTGELQTATRTIFKHLTPGQTNIRNSDGTTVTGVSGQPVSSTASGTGGGAEPINTNIIGGISS